LVNSIISEKNTNQFAYSFGGQQFGFDSYSTAVTTLLATPGETAAQAKAAAAKTVTPIVTTTIASVSAINSTVAVGATTGFTFANSDGTAATPTGVTYSVTSANASTGFFNNGVFTATASGAYTIQATIGTTNLTTTVNVYGVVAGVNLTAASATVVDNGTTLDAITAKAVDANGVTISNFNGLATPSITGIGTLADVNGNALTSVTFTNGVGTFYVKAGSSVPTIADSVSVSGLTYSNGQAVQGTINYGSVNVGYTAATASTITIKPTLSKVSSNGNTENDLAVGIVDSTGNALTTTTPVYVTLTISGPATFTAGVATATTTSIYVTPSVGATVPTFATQGVNGTVTVTATASGLTTANSTFTTVQTTAASKTTITSTPGTLTSSFAVPSGPTLPAGTTFTKYTVQVVDTNGNPSPGADTLTISDNTATLNDGGVLKYFAVLTSGQPDVTNPIAGSASTSSATGAKSFIVLNTSVGVTNPTITVTDSLTTTTLTSPYAYSVGAASVVALVNNTAQNVNAGQSATLAVQLKDAAGNKLALAGQNVYFYFGTNTTTANSTIASSSAWSSTNAYSVLTDSTGKATVTVATPATATGTYQLYAKVAGQTSPVLYTATVSSVATYTTGFALNSVSGISAGSTPVSTNAVAWPTSAVNAGTNVFTTSPYVYGVNAIAQVANTSDTFKVSSSNNNVVYVSATGSATFTAGTQLTTLQAKTAGTATITITNTSNPNTPAITATITVQANAASQVKGMNPDGTFNTAYTFPAAGVSQAFTLNLLDAGNNIVPATAPVTLTASQALSAVGAGSLSGVGVRLTSTGTDVTSVTIPQNQSTVTIYLDNVTASTSTAATSYVALSGELPTAVSSSTTGAAILLTCNNAVFASSVPATTDFTVAVTGGPQSGSAPTVTSVTVSGTTITLGLSTPLVHGDTGITISYTQGANHITTGYGAAMATFGTPLTVTNNS
jgi:hypothetical protein